LYWFLTHIIDLPLHICQDSVLNQEFHQELLEKHSKILENQVKVENHHAQNVALDSQLYLEI